MIIGIIQRFLKTAEYSSMSKVTWFRWQKQKAVDRVAKKITSDIMDSQLEPIDSGDHMEVHVNLLVVHGNTNINALLMLVSRIKDKNLKKDILTILDQKINDEQNDYP